MLELARTQLADLRTGDKREYDVGREPLLEVCFDTQGMRGVDEDARVLRGDYGLDDGREVVDVRECLYAKEDIVEGTTLDRGIFRRANHCSDYRQHSQSDLEVVALACLPWRGLNLSLPKSFDLKEIPYW